MMQETAATDFPKHFDGDRFYNPDAPTARGLADFLRWQFSSRPQRSPSFISDVNPSVPLPRLTGGELRTTLVNHSTVLLQQQTANILTDPIWSDRASPVSFAGPRRRRAPGVLKSDLPPIDIVLLSHNHYDHLDLVTLHWLAARGNSAFVVPLGVARLLESEKIGPLYELDWGQSRTIGETTVHAVPALHFSARGLGDRNKTLWCGYVVEAQDRNVYFAGDTAFGTHFALIRERFGAPLLSFLPIGAYQPRWFMAPVHMAPEEAVKAHEILGSQTSIAIHHGTFQLADDGIDTASRQLVECGRPESFLILRNGESFETPS